MVQGPESIQKVLACPESLDAPPAGGLPE